MRCEFCAVVGEAEDLLELTGELGVGALQEGKLVAAARMSPLQHFALALKGLIRLAKRDEFGLREKASIGKKKYSHVHSGQTLYSGPSRDSRYYPAPTIGLLFSLIICSSTHNDVARSSYQSR